MPNFYKYHALGNDMLVIDPATFPDTLTPNLIRRLCHRNFGVGADGICYGPLLKAIKPLTMRFFNPDGSEAEKSGNGLRVFARYLWDKGYVDSQQFEMWIHNEPIAVAIEDEYASQITTTLGRISFPNPFDYNSLREILSPFALITNTNPPMTAVNIGNPHFVLITDKISAELIRQIGPLLETADPFPNRTNIQLLKVIDKHTIHIEIWERGAGYTLASGTSACASAGAAIYNGRCQSPVKVQMAGGSATVSINDDWTTTLTGTVQAVYSGTLSQNFLLP